MTVSGPESARHSVSETSPVSCELYDYVELACLYQHDVRIRTTDGQTLSGTAVDARADGLGNEFLVLRAPDRTLLVRLNAVTTMETLTDGARAGEVRFR